MYSSLLLKTFALLAIIAVNSFAQSGAVVTYPWAEGMPRYSGVTVLAGGQNIDLHSVRANNTHFWGGGTDAADRCDQIPVAMFDFSGEITISVTVSQGRTFIPENVVVRPASRNITPLVNGRTVSFNISEPGQFSVEYGNHNRYALLIFANPTENFSGTRVLTGGQIHTGTITLEPNETLYLQAGAVLRGNVVMNSNTRVVGRGIIDGRNLDTWMRVPAVLPIETWAGNNLEIDGISIFDPNAWAVQIQHASNVHINNIKIITARANGDGISIQSSNGIRIRNSFIRSWDDGIVIKNYTSRNSFDIVAENCILWTDLAQAIEIGVETNKARANGMTNSDPQIYDVTFDKIDVIHAMHKAPISIHNGDNARIHNIKFTNITVDNYQAGEGDGWNYLIDITNLTGTGMGGAAEWTTETERGSIYDVLIDNVRILSGKMPSARFDSFEGGSIFDIVVRDIFHGAERINFPNSVVGANSQVRFEFSPEDPISITRNFAAQKNKIASFAGIRNGQIQLNLSAGNYAAELYNLQGQMVGKANVTATNGVNAVGLSTDNLAKGVFILNLKQNGVSVLRQKIGVKR
jgi:hypothetical protein